MNEPRFIETIKIKDGILYNLPLHIARLQRTALHFFGKIPSLDLSQITIPDQFTKSLVKCRIVYNDEVLLIEYSSYTFKKINSLRLVECDNIEYNYKTTDRAVLENLLLNRKGADDILIVKNGLIIDTSFTNVVFENSDGFFTPKSYLLNGTKRQYLLQRGIVQEIDIRKDDVTKFDKIYLINAMIDLEDNVCISTTDLIFS